MTARTDGRKPHWSTLPENEAKVRAMVKKREKTRQAKKKAKKTKATKKAAAPKTKKVPSLLMELALIGAQHELDIIEKRATTLRMFLKRS